MIDAGYIVGLSDGEGCFYVNLTERDKTKNPNAHIRAKAHFYIKLREDNLPVLVKVRSYLGFGFIYIQKEKRVNHSTCYRFEVNSNTDKLKLIDFFKKHPLQSPKKIRDFKIFSKVTRMIINREHFNQKGVTKIQGLKASMHHQGSPGAGNPLARWEREVIFIYPNPPVKAVKSVAAEPPLFGLYVIKEECTIFYVLKSQKKGSLYFGQTSDLRKRLFKHNSGTEKATKNGTPWSLIYYEAYASNLNAFKRERQIKKFKSAYGFLKQRIFNSLNIIESKKRGEAEIGDKA